MFHTTADRLHYLALFDQYRKKHGLDVWAWCLMTNHVHFVVVPRNESSLAQTFRGAHTRFSLSMNKRRNECGHLWQNRFFSCPLDETHLWAAVRYVERNPVRAGLVKRADDYAWSSAAAHCGKRRDDLLAPDFPPPGVIPNWRAWLAKEDAQQTEAIRCQTHTGRPCGSAAFIERLESLLERVLAPQKAGRKKKTTEVPEQAEINQ